jgi:deoxyribodipyrimidine photo-lyase
MEWKQKIARAISVPLVEVDAHNIVPCRHVSQKQEFGAYTLRPKIHRMLHTFLETPGELPVFKGPEIKTDTISPLSFLPAILLKEVAETSVIPGSAAAEALLEDFIEERLNPYASERNDPNLNALSGLSPYLHFGHISSARVAVEVIKSRTDEDSKKAFLEELIVRKELSDNYCLYNSNYDNMQGLPAWAKKELELHRKDEREYLYELPVFEQAATHDPLWNAAQKEMLITGKMHGYMRMYWAKKILEWTLSPEKVFETAVYLNDKYSLDGRDPNGYAGIAWAIGGLHDRAWASRPVYGKIRYMNDKGCARKFNVAEYIARWGV